MAVERVFHLKNSMVSGIWGNPNYDEGDTRDSLLRRIDNFYEEAVKEIYEVDPEYVNEIDLENDPFFTAMKRPNQLLLDKDSVKGIE